MNLYTLIMVIFTDVGIKDGNQVINIAEFKVQPQTAIYNLSEKECTAMEASSKYADVLSEDGKSMDVWICKPQGKNYIETGE